MIVNPKIRVSIYSENVIYADNPLQVNPKVTVLPGKIIDYMSELSDHLGKTAISQLDKTSSSIVENPLIPKSKTNEPEKVPGTPEKTERRSSRLEESMEAPSVNKERKSFRISSRSRARSLSKDGKFQSNGNSGEPKEQTEGKKILNSSMDSRNNDSFLWKSRVLDNELRVKKFRDSFKVDARTGRPDRTFDRTRRFNAVLEDVLKSQNDLEKNETLLKQVHKLHEGKRIRDVTPKIHAIGRVSNFLANINDLHCTASRNGYTRGDMGKFYTK